MKVVIGNMMKAIATGDDLHNNKKRSKKLILKNYLAIIVLGLGELN